MAVHNADIAAAFEEIADLLDISGENPFRIRAYRNAARTVESYGKDIAALLTRGEELPKLPGIGTDLAAKIGEIARGGSCALLEQLRGRVPAAVAELLKLPGLGPRRVKALHEALGIQSLTELQAAAQAGKVRDLPGFGEKTELRILQALESRAASAQRFLLATAGHYAAALQSWLEGAPGAGRVCLAGSFRRMRDTVGDLDFIVTARAGQAVVDHFCRYDEVATILAQGPTRGSVKLKSGLQADLRVVEEESYGAALHYFTGSKAHNIAIRRLGQSLGLKINEYGVFRGRRRIAGATEESVYAAVKLPYIEPELREERGEIEAARAGTLPRLITLGDLKGDLHVHTRASDGHASLGEMAAAAKAAGLSYIAITEHTRHLTVARGLDPRRLARQIDEIDALNAELPGFTVLKGTEVDILEDGALDLPDAILARLDLVVGAVHSAFELSRRKQTDRLLRAMDSRYFSILAHPGGRRIGSRDACDIDMLKILRRARQRGCCVELNAQPERLDLQDIYCQMARDEGVLVSVASDAHRTTDYAYLRFGIGQARRGWLEAKDVLNTRSLTELRRLLAPTMER